MSLAFIFPGQGSQAVGMDAGLAVFRCAREVFQEVDEALSQNLSRLMREGPIEELTRTENAQPALMAVSVAIIRTLSEEMGAGVEGAAFVAGHSLGEYSALAAVRALGLAQTARLLRLRGLAMQRAVPPGEGAMVSLIGPKADLQTAEAAAAAGSIVGVCVVANDNNVGNVVVSGASAAVERAVARAKELGMRAVPLNVSAPFHCPLMAPAADEMSVALRDADIRAPTAPLVANVTATATSEPAEIRRLLLEQITSRVRWRESVGWMVANGVDRFVEVGPGKVLTSMVRRIAPEARADAVNSPIDLETFAASL